MQITGQATIFKNDKGAYKIPISNKEITEEGEEQTIFMQINAGFKKGTEVKNKSKIDIKEAFLTFFRIEIETDGKTEYKKFPKIMIMDFDLLEDGIDEVFKTKDYSNSSNNESNDFYSNSDDDLPF